MDPGDPGVSAQMSWPLAHKKVTILIVIMTVRVCPFYYTGGRIGIPDLQPRICKGFAEDCLHPEFLIVGYCIAFLGVSYGSLSLYADGNILYIRVAAQ